MELFEELLLFNFEILELLQSILIVPLDLLGGLIILGDTLSSLGQLLHDNIVLFLLFKQSINIFICFLEWLNNLIVSFLLVHLLLLLVGVFFSSVRKLIFQLLDNIEIGVRNLLVILFDITILFLMLSDEVCYGRVLNLLDSFDLGLADGVHFFAHQFHLVDVFGVDFVADSLKLVFELGLLLILLLGKSIEILLVSYLLLFLGDLNGSQVLFELSFIDPVFILNILQGNLSLFLELGQLIEVLENKMLTSLLVDLNLNLMSLIQILEFSLLVSELGLFVF